MVNWATESSSLEIELKQHEEGIKTTGYGVDRAAKGQKNSITNGNLMHGSYDDIHTTVS